MKRFFPAILALLLLPVLWRLIPYAEFHTDVEILYTPQTVTFILNGQVLSAPLELKNIRELEIHTIESAFPMGGGELTLEQNGRQVFKEPLPEQFATQSGQAHSLGDWWVDEHFLKPVHPVYRRPLSLDGPFRLRLRFTGRNLQDTQIRLVGEEGARFGFRTGLLNKDFCIKNGDGWMVENRIIGSHSARHLGNILEPVLRGLFVACALVILFTLLGWIFIIISRFSAPPATRSEPLSPIAPLSNPTGSSRLAAWGAILSVGGLALVSLALSLWVANSILACLPHFQDDFCYLLRAKWLSAGWLSMPVPAYWAALEIPHTYINSETGRWLTIYPIGWPLILAAGEWLGAAWAVPPVCGAVGMVLVYLLGRELYGHWTGLAAMLLAILSPMSVLMSASLLSHAATTMFLALFFYWFITGWKRQSCWRLLGAGLALGYTFGIRPLTAVAVAAPVGLFLLMDVAGLLIRRSPQAVPKLSRRTLAGLALLIIGGLAGTVPALLDNYHATGSPLLFAYTAGPKQHHWTLDNLGDSLQTADATLATVLPMAFGWGYRLISGWPILSLTYAFALVVFLTGRATKYDWLLLATFLAVPIAYLGHDSSGAHGYGPRFYYDVFFALFLLTARGFAILGDLPRRGANSALIVRADAGSAGPLPAGAGPSPAKSRVAKNSLRRLLLVPLFIALCASAAITLPQRILLYRGYNEIGRSIRNFDLAVREAGVKRGIILLDNPSHLDWIETANVFPADVNRTDLIIAARQEDNSLLFELHPDLPVYLWSDGALTPYRR